MPKHEYGREGAYLQNEALKRALIWIGLPMFAGLIIAGLAFARVLPPPFYVGLLLFVPFAPRAAKEWEKRADAALDPHLKGFGGERAVADALRVLGDDCYLVHDVDLGRGNVDHIAIAPAGIFTIETKAWQGSIRTEGDRLVHNGHDNPKVLKQAYAEAMAVRDYLERISAGRKYRVTPLVVFTEAKVDSQGRCAGVFVMRIGRLAQFIQRGKPVLEPLERSRISGALGTRVVERR